MSETRLRKIEDTREKMILSALEKGVLNQNTIKLSEELDQLLNDFQHIDRDEEQTKKSDNKGERVN
ncbi:aspartyl-phosphate phosphatase Spo0E family protein [Psychrobacillus psychrodurans]|uniref:Aspartyl-phosphate phosphatase Spo0E family protein n=1 Tax=Psychrobacillus psychrodurans TaxID=126157 RepID=A0A9X3LB68_9BACI|nr:aspartyl-phosphate phosphatase Spo0E family protein [Psychrobacillus psychrodurans]MCZ8532974.1 aspartyl-phosphate phosphatase Spo0E family protein [Psychrobacillus psychrodurans]